MSNRFLPHVLYHMWYSCPVATPASPSRSTVCVYAISVLPLTLRRHIDWQIACLEIEQRARPITASVAASLRKGKVSILSYARLVHGDTPEILARTWGELGWSWSCSWSWNSEDAGDEGEE